MTELNVGRNRNELQYEELLSKIGFGKTQFSLLAISGLLTITSMAPQQAIGIISIASQCQFHASQAEKGAMLASCVTGIFVSTYFWGYLSDILGRRTVLLYGTFLSVILQIVSLFTSNFWFFNTLNFVSGIGLGGVSAAIYAYISEFTEQKYRAIVINYSTMFVSLTSVYVPAISWLVLSHDFTLEITETIEFQAWRLIILFSLLPGFLGACWLLRFPESPKFLISQDRNHEVADVIEWICKFNTGQSLSTIIESRQMSFKLEDSDSAATESVSINCDILLNLWTETKKLFRKPHKKNFLITVLAVFGMFFCSSVQVWYPEIINRVSNSDESEAKTICNILDASFSNNTSDSSTSMIEECITRIASKTYLDTIVIGTAFFVGFIAQGFLINYVGRKKITITALLIAVLASLTLIFTTNAVVLLLSFCLFLLFPGLSISVMLGVVVDFVPTDLRAKTVSMTLTLGRLGIIVSSYLIGVMLEPLCETTFYMFTATILLCVVCVYYLPFK